MDAVRERLDAERDLVSAFRAVRVGEAGADFRLARAEARLATTPVAPTKVVVSGRPWWEEHDEAVAALARLGGIYKPSVSGACTEASMTLKRVPAQSMQQFVPDLLQKPLMAPSAVELECSGKRWDGTCLMCANAMHAVSNAERTVDITGTWSQSAQAYCAHCELQYVCELFDSPG